MPSSLGNRITRKIYVSGTTNPLIRAIVYAHPVNVTGTTQDVLMPEVPADSGFYVTSNEVKHGTYTFKVNGAMSDDEVTVEPGRVAVGIGSSDSSKIQYPLIDKVMRDRIRLSSFLADGTSVASTQNMVDAIDMAVATGAELAMDIPCAFNVYKAGAGTLRIDLCGRTFDLSDKIVYDAVYIRNGKIHLSPGAQIKQATGKATFECVEFDGSIDQQVTNAYCTYISCNGITYDPSTSTDKNQFIGGNVPFGIPNQLRLTDPLSVTGRGRLDALQDFIDNHMKDAISNVGADGWLTEDKRNKIDAALVPASYRRRMSSMYAAPELNHVGFFSYMEATDPVLYSGSTNLYLYKFLRVRAKAKYLKAGLVDPDVTGGVSTRDNNTILIRPFAITQEDITTLGNEFTGVANSYAMKVMKLTTSGQNYTFSQVTVPSVTLNKFARSTDPMNGKQIIAIECTPMLSSSGVELDHNSDVVVYLTLPNNTYPSLVPQSDW